MKRWFPRKETGRKLARLRAAATLRRRGWAAGSFCSFETLEPRELLAADPAAASVAQQAYGQLPLSFEVNQGQTDRRVDFLARGAGYTLFLTGNGAVIDLPQSPSSTSAGEISGAVINMQFVGANASATVTGLDKQQTQSNYFVGNDPSQWRTGVANFARVEYQNIYSGVNAVFYGNQQQLEYDFNVAPGADLSQIQWQIDGASGLSLDGSGNLLIHTAAGDLVEKAPNIYQEAGGVRVAIAGHFVLEGDNRVGFAVGSYDASLPLVIDPTLSYSTYLGGTNADAGNAIAVDGAGNAYVTGLTTSTDFPTTVGAYQRGLGGTDHAFVAKLSADGRTLLYSTFLGGSGDNSGQGIAVDGAGNAYVTGFTNAANFPTTAGALQRTPGGFDDAFVTKLSADGSSLIYSTYLGASSNDSGNGIVIDGAGNAYVTGDTQSTDFPTTEGVIQRNFGGFQDAFAAKLNATGRLLVYSTYLGGGGVDSGAGIAIDGAGNAYLAGAAASTNFPTTANVFQTGPQGATDAFAAKLSSDARRLLYSTYLGGANDDGANGIAVDGAGNAYVAGFTASTNFPTTPGGFQKIPRGGNDAFVTKINPIGTSLVYSTFLGGGVLDSASGIAVDASGAAYVTGSTNSTNFPTTSGAIQTSSGGRGEAFVTKLAPSGGSLEFSTYLGGTVNDSGQGIAIDGAGSAYVTGFALSPNFPTTPGALQPSLRGAQNAFISKIASIPPATPVDVDATPNIVVEGAANGTYVGLTVFSTASQGGPLVYAIAADSSGGGFQIDPASGRVTVADSTKISFGAAANHAYQIVVQATTGDGSSAAQIFTIVVAVDVPHNQRFVSEAYHDLLHRDVDPAGLAYWTSLLSAGATRVQLVLAMEQTFEYRQLVVEDLYNRYLHRTPDAAGLNFFAQLLGQGVTVEQVGAALAGSDEFFAAQGGGSVDGFLNAVYQDTFGRPIDPNGLAWWSSRLAAGVTRAQAVDLILSTDEYRQEVVEGAYQQFLDRPADAGGLAGWVNAMRAGASDQLVNAGVAGSGEYFAKTG